MAQLKIVPKEDWNVLDKYLHRGADVVLVPEEALLDGSLGSMASKIRDLEGYVDYNFGGELAAPEYNGANFPAGPGACHVVVSFAGNWPVIDVQPL